MPPFPLVGHPPELPGEIMPSLSEGVGAAPLDEKKIEPLRAAFSFMRWSNVRRGEARGIQQSREARGAIRVGSELAMLGARSLQSDESAPSRRLRIGCLLLCHVLASCLSERRGGFSTSRMYPNLESQPMVSPKRRSAPHLRNRPLPQAPR